MIAGDQAEVSVTLAVPPADAFDIFTREIDLWWRRGPRFRNVGGEEGVICIEPRVGGRIFESRGDDAAVEIGSVTTWEPPRRLVFTWRAGNFAPGEKTEVAVQFEPSRSGTRVTVIHRGWSRIRADHPVRHGHDTRAFIRMMGLWWGDQLTSLRMNCAWR